MATDMFKEGVEAVLPVKELPQVNAGRIQAETVTGIGVEENGPVVKLLPEHDVRVGYGFFAVFHGRIPFTLIISPDRATLIESTQRFDAICVPRYHGVLYHSKNIYHYGLLHPKFSGSHRGNDAFLSHNRS
jgi:hypothetical protein